MYRTELNERLLRLMPTIQKSPISSISTNLMKAGLVVGGGRGISAPHIRTVDVVNTLLGVSTSGSPTQAVQAVMEYRQLEGEKGVCCGIPSGDDPWVLSDILEEVLSFPDKCTLIQKLVFCWTEPYAEIHWQYGEYREKDGEWEPDGPLKIMSFGKKSADFIGNRSVSCTIQGFVLSQLAIDLKSPNFGNQPD